MAEAMVTRMSKGRLEAFSDGVIAIIITIMVLELKVPDGATLQALFAIAPTFAAYAFSFIYVGIYWNNHHHMMHAVRSINGGALWANLHLLFWLSLVPFTTRWVGVHIDETWPVVVYGVSLLMPSIAFGILVQVLIRANGRDSVLAKAIGGDVKGTASTLIYITGIALTLWRPWAGLACYVLVALIWLVPDRRIERAAPEG